MRLTRARFLAFAASALLLQSAAVRTQAAPPPLRIEPTRSPEELKFIEWLEQVEGRKLTDQEINLAIDQAKYVAGVL